MTQANMHHVDDVGDEEIRHSIRVIKQQRNAKLLGVIIAAIVGILVLFVASYLQFGGR
jgi:hypothetical protein